MPKHACRQLRCILSRLDVNCRRVRCILEKITYVDNTAFHMVFLLRSPLPRTIHHVYKNGILEADCDNNMIKHLHLALEPPIFSVFLYILSLILIMLGLYISNHVSINIKYNYKIILDLEIKWLFIK